jgi:hypothetical protein
MSREAAHAAWLLSGRRGPPPYPLIDGRDPLDRDYTPGPLARAIIGVLPIEIGDRILEGHVGDGAFAHPLDLEYAHLIVSDLDPGASGLHLPGAVSLGARDFLTLNAERDLGGPVDWTLGNPPFSRPAGRTSSTGKPIMVECAEDHVRHALTLGQNTAFILRLGWLGSKRRKPFFDQHPPRVVWVVQGRPSYRQGKGTDAREYGVFWWDNDHDGPTELRWLSWHPDR